jgi:hypothetical protein
MERVQEDSFGRSAAALTTNSLTTLGIAAILSRGCARSRGNRRPSVLRFYPGPATIREPSSVAVRTDETNKRGLRAALYVEEFFRRQGTSYEREPVVDSEPATTEQPSSDIDHLMQGMLLPDLRRRLEDANFINYSLGDHRRALAAYQRLVDYYPDTDAAMEARVKIRAILDTEYSIRAENVDVEETTDREI